MISFTYVCLLPFREVEVVATNDGSQFIVYANGGEVEFADLSMRDRLLIRQTLDDMIKEGFLNEASLENCNFTEEMMAEHGPYEYGLVDELNGRNN